jgi:hypothetical protein
MIASSIDALTPLSENPNALGQHASIIGSLGSYPDATTELQQRMRLMELCVEVLIGQTKIFKLWEEGYQETARFLQTLPLTTSEFDLARLRLENALRYCRRREFGAAAFELRALRSRVQRL